MTDQSAHIRWKTDAWKDPGFVAGYAARMDDVGGTSLLKNRVETGIFRRYVTGNDVLDVGIGTGRASLPLARDGKRVTGVDSSQAMLDKCRELAAGTPIHLLPGDVSALPFGDGTFDTVMSLNTMTHFPHWQDILREWRRVVRPGGEVIFDVYSLDHDIAYARAIGKPDEYGVSHFAAKDVRSFYLRVALEELLTVAAEFGLRIRAVIPYSAFFGSAGFNRFLERTQLDGKSWDRLLSWVGSDDRLFDFLTWMEERIVAHLPVAAACRFMAVFDVQDDSRANNAWLARDRDYAQALASGFSFSAFGRFTGEHASTARSELNGHLAHEPNRFAFARMLTTTQAWNWDAHIAEWVDEHYRGQLEHIMTLASANDVTLALIRSLSASQPIAQALAYRGLHLEKAFAYEMMSSVLDEGCQVFNSTLSGEPA